MAQGVDFQQGVEYWPGLVLGVGWVGWLVCMLLILIVLDCVECLRVLAGVCGLVYDTVFGVKLHINMCMDFTCFT